MGTSQKTFNQVKSILGTLDRAIDNVRQRRLGDAVPARPKPALTNNTGSPTIGPSLNTTIGTGSSVAVAGPAAVHQPAPSRSGYGRAQPLRPEARSA